MHGRDGSLDVYYDPALANDPAFGYLRGARSLTATAFRKARLEFGLSTIDAFAAFDGVDGRPIELAVRSARAEATTGVCTCDTPSRSGSASAALHGRPHPDPASPLGGLGPRWRCGADASAFSVPRRLPQSLLRSRRVVRGVGGIQPASPRPGRGLRARRRRRARVRACVPAAGGARRVRRAAGDLCLVDVRRTGHRRRLPGRCLGEWSPDRANRRHPTLEAQDQERLDHAVRAG